MINQSRVSWVYLSDVLDLHCLPDSRPGSADPGGEGGDGDDRLEDDRLEDGGKGVGVESLVVAIDDELLERARGAIDSFLCPTGGR